MKATDFLDEPVAKSAEDFLNEGDKGVSVGDYAKSLAAGALSGVGMTFHGGGRVLASGINAGAEALGLPSPELRAEDPTKAWQDSLLESRSPAIKQAEADSQISGGLNPSTWSLGKNPSVAGLSSQVVNALGQYIPQVGVALATGGLSMPAQFATGAAVGALQGAGGGAEDEADKIANMTDAQLAAGSQMYRDLIASKISPAAARDAVSKAAQTGGAWGQAIPSGLETGVENVIISALSRGAPWAKALFGGGGLTRKIATGFTGGALTQGAEEGFEQMSQNKGSNLAIGGNRPIDADFAQNTIMGAASGGVAGGAGGGVAHFGPQETAPAPAIPPAPALTPHEKILDDVAKSVIQKSQAEALVTQPTEKPNDQQIEHPAASETRPGETEANAGQNANAAQEALLDVPDLGTTVPNLGTIAPEVGNAPAAEQPISAPAETITPKTVGGIPVSAQSTEQLQAVAQDPETPATTRHAAVAAVQARIENPDNGQVSAAPIEPNQLKIAPQNEPVATAGTVAPVAEKATNVTEKATIQTESKPEPGTTVAPKQQLFAQWGGQTHPVESLEDASRKWESFRDKTHAGVSEVGNGISIVDQTGKEVARVSYNGRVWGPGEAKPDAKPLYIPNDQLTAREKAQSSALTEYKAAERKLADAEPATKEYADAYAVYQAARSKLESVQESAPSTKNVQPKLVDKPISATAENLKQGPEVERFQGQYKKGMADRVAKAQQKRLSSEKPELAWTVEKSTIAEFPDRFDVVGRAIEAPAIAQKPSESPVAAQPATPAQPTAKQEIASPAPASQGESAKLTGDELINDKPAKSYTIKALKQYAEKAKNKATKAAAEAELERRADEQAAKPLTEKQIANNKRLADKAKARRIIDQNKDSLLEAIAKKGGINIAERNQIMGDKSGNHNVPFVGAVFSKDGMGLDDMATSLAQDFYLSPQEMEDGGVNVLMEKVREDMDRAIAKRPQAHFSTSREQLSMQEEMQRRQQDAFDRETERVAEDAKRAAELKDAVEILTPEDLADLDDKYGTLPDAEFQAKLIERANELHANQRPNAEVAGNGQEAGAAQTAAAETKPAEVAPAGAAEAIAAHSLPENTGWERGKGRIKDQWAASAQGVQSNYHPTADAAAAELRQFLDTAERGKVESAAIVQARTVAAEKIKRGENPTFDEWKAAFPQLREGHTYLRQPDVSPFLVEHFGFKQNAIREGLGKAAGMVTSDTGAKYPIVYFNKLAEALSARPALDLAAQTEADLKAKAAREADQATADRARLKAESEAGAKAFNLQPQEKPVAQREADNLAATGDIFSKPANTLSPADLLRAAASKLDEAAKPAPEPAPNPAAQEPPILSEKQGGIPDKNEPLFSKGASSPIFYSALARGLESANIKSAPAAAWRDYIKGLVNKGAVKTDEVEWTGINDWLATQEGKVTKEQVQAFMEQGGVKVTESTYGDLSPESQKAIKEARDNAEAARMDFVGAVDDAIQYLEQGGVKQLQLANARIALLQDRPGEGSEALSRAYDLLHKYAPKDYDSNTINDYYDAWKSEIDRADEVNGWAERTGKFSDYQLPGSVQGSYRELVLTLPGKPTQAEAALDALTEKIRARVGRGSFQYEDMTPAEYADFQRLTDRIVAEGPTDPATKFESSHFRDAGNYLAHTRVNDRILPDGRKVLFVEEIQSDRAQKGRQEGFKDDVGFERSLTPEERELRDYNSRTWRGAEQALSDAELARAAELQKKVGVSLVEKANRFGGKIAPAPFVTKTDSWTALVLKRLLRYAAEGNYDAIAWTRGDQQVERYTSALRKAVDVIEWKKTPEGVQIVGYKGKDNYAPMSARENELRRREANGIGTATEAREIADLRRVRENERTKVVDTTEKESALSDAIGKSMADRIRNDPNQTGTIEGENITVSDTGMAGYYDKIVPKVAQEVAKKVGGGKVTSLQIENLADLPLNEILGREFGTMWGGSTEAQKQRAMAIKNAPNGKYAVAVTRTIEAGNLEGRQATVEFVPDESYGRHKTILEAKAAYARALDPDLKNADDTFAARHFDQQARNLKHAKIVEVEPVTGPTQQAIEITPAMREKIMAGQALFSNAQSAGTTDTITQAMRERGLALRERIAELIGDRPDVKVKTFMATPESPLGMYAKTDFGSVITMALNAKDELSIADHEGFHAAEDLILSDPEREVVGNALRTGRPLFNRAMQAARIYDKANGTAIANEIATIPAEARAYAFEFYRRGDLKADGVIGRIFQKLQQFFERIQNAVNGLGFTSAEDVFRALDEGRLANREQNAEGAGVLEPQFARRIFNTYRTARDFIVPETPQYEGNMSGDLASVPKAAAKKGVEALPIRLPVGVTYGPHTGYGLMHLKGNADVDTRREPAAATQDRAENFARQVVDILNDTRQIYTDAAKSAIFYSPNLRAAVVAAIKTDRNGDYYSITTARLGKPDLWGNPVWSGRLAFPDSSRGNSEPPVQSAGQSTTTTGPDRAEVQTEKFDFTTKQPTVQYKGRKIDRDTKFSHAAVQGGAMEGALNITPWKTIKEGVPATFYAYRGEGNEGRGLLTEKWQRKYGRKELLGEGIYVAPTQNRASHYGTTSMVRVTLNNPFVLRSATGTDIVGLNLDEVKQRGHDGIVILAGRAEGNEDMAQAIVFPEFAAQVEKDVTPKPGELVKGATVRLTMPTKYGGQTYEAGTTGKIVSLSPWGHPNIKLPNGKTISALNLSEIEVLSDKFPRNPQALFSRAAMASGSMEGARQVFSDITRSDRVLNRLISKFNTPFHLAETHPEFKPVYNEAQDYNQDVSRFANEGADLAPDLLPRIESFADFKKQTPSVEDVGNTADALYAGTLWGGGSPLEGRVWSDSELKSGRAEDNGAALPAGFKPMNDKQVSLYRQALAAVAHSLTEHSKSLIWRLAKQKDIRLNQSMNLARMVDLSTRLADQQIEGKQATLEQTEEAKDKAPVQKAIDELNAFKASVADIEAKTNGLIEHGYFPSMRFGQYAVNVQTLGKDGKWTEEYFGRFETQTAANIAKRELAKEFPNSQVTSGVMNTDAYKLFQGLNLDSLELFAKHMTDETGKPVELDPLMQEYFRIATTERSTLKRQIHRKGTPGFSKDVARALAQFTVSNATATSRAYHASGMMERVQNIKAGDLQAYATRYVRYLQDPQEEAAMLRGFLANYYILGSIAFGAVNMTQPILMTAPYLSEHTSWTNAMKQLGIAAKDLVTGRKSLTPDEKAAFEKAVKAGIVSPQEIHQIRAEGRASMMGDSPLWQKMEGMAAARGIKLPGKLLMRKAAFLWGSVYSMTEQWNRGITFLSAYRIAKEKGGINAYDFAKTAVDATQGVYAKSNRPEVSRGTIGSSVMTFKQFSISYVELAKRLYDHDKKAFAVLMLTLMALAGAEGLPFAEDIEDLIDTLGQWMGYSTNIKKSVRKRVTDILGQDIAGVMLHGMSAIPGVPIDVAQRMGMHNLIPGSAMLKTSESDKTRDIMDILGPGASLFKNAGTAVEGLATGKPSDVKMLLPLALQNVAKGAEIAETGQYRDMGGRKVMDASLMDAMWKTVGFQPAKVARESAIVKQNMQDIGLQKVIESSIADKWARGIVDKDPEKVAEARAQWRQWNTDNPDAKVVINSGQISRRVKELRLSREERFVKRSPQEMRRDISADIRSGQ